MPLFCCFAEMRLPRGMFSGKYPDDGMRMLEGCPVWTVMLDTTSFSEDYAPIAIVTRDDVVASAVWIAVNQNPLASNDVEAISSV